MKRVHARPHSRRLSSRPMENTQKLRPRRWRFSSSRSNKLWTADIVCRRSTGCLRVTAKAARSAMTLFQSYPEISRKNHNRWWDSGIYKKKKRLTDKRRKRLQAFSGRSNVVRYQIVALNAFVSHVQQFRGSDEPRCCARSREFASDERLHAAKIRIFSAALLCSLLRHADGVAEQKPKIWKFRR